MEFRSQLPDLLVAEQVRNLYAPAIAISISAMLSTLIIGGALWPFGRHPVIVAWEVGIALCQVSITLITWTYHRRQPQPAAAWRWGLYKTIYAAALGLCWSLGSIFLYDPGEPRTGFVLALGIAAPTAVSLSVNAYFPPNLYAFVLASILPFLAYLVTFSDPISGYLAAGLIVHLIFISYGGRKQVLVIQENIRMRLDMADLAAGYRQQAREAREARAQAEAASAEKSLFFGAASHDLRQPLHALGLYVSLLRKNPEHHERSELLDHAANCVDSLNRLFNAILGVSSADEAGQWALPVPLSVQAAFERVRIQFRPQAEAKGLQLHVVPSRRWVRTDPEVFERILNNLVENAIRYTVSGRILVGVRGGEGRCRIVVADTGIGIDPAQLEWIFDDFRQIGNAARDRKLGFGLGLATVRRLCSAFDYPLAVRSTPGRGSIFSFAVPLTLPVSGSTVIAQSEDDVSGVSVLYVEDDALVCDAMRRMLADWNLPCVICANGADALASLASQPERSWHVLLDFRLAEGENGLAIADRIIATVSPVPMITLVTGEIDPALAEAAQERGISLLRKPLKPLRLRATLAQRKRLAGERLGTPLHDRFVA